MAKQGKTTGNLKMRSGPGMQYEPPIAFLVPDTALEILGDEGDWWKVRAAGKEGYVGKKYVAVTETPEPADTPPAASGDSKALTGVDKSGSPKVPARPVVKPAPAKGIAADPSAVNPTHAPQKTAPKVSSVKPGLSKPGQAKPKGPPAGQKKK